VPAQVTQKRKLAKFIFPTHGRLVIVQLSLLLQADSPESLGRGR